MLHGAGSCDAPGASGSGWAEGGSSSEDSGVAQYTARLAPGLLAAPGKRRCLVVDVLDEWALNPETHLSQGLQAAAAALSSSTGSDRDGGTFERSNAGEAAGPGGGAVQLQPLRCADVLPGMVEQLGGLQDALSQLRGTRQEASPCAASGRTSAAAAGSDQGGASGGGARPAAPLTCTGQLAWTLLDNGTWAIPLQLESRSRRARVLWLRPNGRGGYVPELEEGTLVKPLTPTGRAIKLQRARVSVERMVTCGRVNMAEAQSGPPGKKCWGIWGWRAVAAGGSSTQGWRQAVAQFGQVLQLQCVQGGWG